jgi:chemotaxis family two-component system response regulator Rcp1
MPLEVLLVEDNDGDVRLLRDLLHGTNKSVRLHVVSDGIEALAFLKYQGRYLDAPRPGLILLDLNMPRMDGREVLSRIKRDPHLNMIPIIVLATSEAEKDALLSERVNCHLNKPEGLPQFDSLVKCLNDFWLTRAALPKPA